MPRLLREHRVKLVQRPHTPYHQLEWYDADAGRMRTRSTGETSLARAEVARARLVVELAQGARSADPAPARPPRLASDATVPPRA